jgi:hypothetical protein
MPASNGDRAELWRGAKDQERKIQESKFLGELVWQKPHGSVFALGRRGSEETNKIASRIDINTLKIM